MARVPYRLGSLNYCSVGGGGGGWLPRSYEFYGLEDFVYANGVLNFKNKYFINNQMYSL